MILSDAVDLTVELFGFEGWDVIDSENARIGDYWIGMTACENWAVFDKEPEGALLEVYETVADAMAGVVARHASDVFEEAAL